NKGISGAESNESKGRLCRVQRASQTILRPSDRDRSRDGQADSTYAVCRDEDRGLKEEARTSQSTRKRRRRIVHGRSDEIRFSGQEIQGREVDSGGIRRRQKNRRSS